jgi:hypothetical protein
MKKKLNILLNSKIQRNPKMVTSNLDGEIVMMSVENGEYYGLDETGTRIWELLEKTITVDELINSLINEFEIDRETCKHDTMEFLEDMISKNLILIK